MCFLNGVNEVNELQQLKESIEDGSSIIEAFEDADLVCCILDRAQVS